MTDHHVPFLTRCDQPSPPGMPFGPGASRSWHCFWRCRPAATPFSDRLSPRHRGRRRPRLGRAGRPVRVRVSRASSPACASTRRRQHGHPHRQPVVERGALLATATFTNETADWLAAGELHTAGADRGEHRLRRVLLRAAGSLQRESRLLRQSGVDNAPLHALANTEVVGRQRYLRVRCRDHAFPMNTFDAVNYWVDVVFSPETAATLTSLSISPFDPMCRSAARSSSWPPGSIRTAPSRT